MNEAYQYQSSLLIDEPPMLMLPSLAKALKSADKAIMVQQIHYWLQIKRKANDARAFHDGRWWVFNSIQQWHDQFIWMSERTIRRNLDELSKMGIIIVSRFNNKAFDRTKWYTLDYDLLDQLAQGPKKPQADAFSDSGQSNRPTWPQQPSNMAPTSVQADLNNRPRWTQQPAKVTKPIPEITSKITSETISKTSSSSSAYSINSEYIHSNTTASSLSADDDAGRTQSGQSLTQSAPTASPVQPQRLQRQAQPSGWTEPADPSGPDSLADPNGMNAIFHIWADLWSRPSSTTIADLTGWVKDFGPDVVLYAIKKAATADASRPHAYMAAIIRGYRNAGIKTLDEVKAADQAREQRSQQKQSYGWPQYNNGNRGSRASVQEQLPDWAKQDDEAQDKPKTAEQLDGERLERNLHRAVMLQQQLYGVDLTAICHNLDQPDGHGYLSTKAPKLFEQYCAQNHLDVTEEIKKARETADFD